MCEERRESKSMEVRKASGLEGVEVAEMRWGKGRYLREGKLRKEETIR